MTFAKNNILTLNGGSSSIKFALFHAEGPLMQLMIGSIENIGSGNSTFHHTDNITKQKTRNALTVKNYADASVKLMDWLTKQNILDSVKAIGHRIVQGMQHTMPEKVTDELLEKLKQISAYDPEHLPGEIGLVELFRQRYPELLQVACFDTAFHTTMPLVAKMLAIPRRYYVKGIQRYGFHGLSYAYLMHKLNEIAGTTAANGKVILAHLGSGASLAAIKNGKSIDTSMGFTPTSGLPMSTRTGDLDPGVAWYLMDHEHLRTKQFGHLINHESGLLGISETSADMQELIKISETDHRAKEAVDLFCYQTKKWIGSYSAALGGLDALVFAGGIGENSPEVRSKTCDGLGFLGIELDEAKNVLNETIISTVTSTAKVYVIKTDEELMIAKFVADML